MTGIARWHIQKHKHIFKTRNGHLDLSPHLHHSSPATSASDSLGESRQAAGCRLNARRWSREVKEGSGMALNAGNTADITVDWPNSVLNDWAAGETYYFRIVPSPGQFLEFQEQAPQ